MLQVGARLGLHQIKSPYATVNFLVWCEHNQNVLLFSIGGKIVLFRQSNCTRQLALQRMFFVRILKDALHTHMRTAAPCNIEHSNKAFGWLCKCNVKFGYEGVIAWNGATPSGSCKYVDRVGRSGHDTVVTPVVDEGSRCDLHLLELLFVILFVF